MIGNRLQDRVCIVTGAASGIGRAIARRFAGEGAQVIILDPRSEPVEGGESTEVLIRNAGGKVTTRAVDVSVWEDVDQVVSDAVAEYGALHVMVSNAAIYTGTDLLATIAAISPMLGFFGTVTGMIKAFQQIQNLQGNVNPSVLAGGIWERIFSEKRGRELDTGFLYTAVVVVFLMPPSVSLIHIALGTSFAIVFGNAVFGGEGKTFLCPALVGVAIMQISFPGALVDQAPWTSINGYAGTTLFADFHLDGSAALAWSGVDLWGAVLGSTQGLMGTTSLLAIAVGGIVLMRGGMPHGGSWSGLWPEP